MKKLGIFLALSLAVFSASAPAAAAKDELIVGHVADIRTLDPVQGSDNISANIHLNMFDNLVFINQKGELEPMLAESWEQPSPNVYVFHIRKGVKFHNGDECTAEDVKFTLDRAKSPIGVAAHALIKGVVSVDVIDRYTVKIVLDEPSSPFLYALGESWGGIVSKKAVEAGIHPTTPIGTGPFKFVQWLKGDKVILERFDDYWGEKPTFKRLVQRAIPETPSRTIELESGGVDIIFDVHHTDMQRIKDNPKLRLVRYPSFVVQYFGINCRHKPLDDERVRQAIFLAVDTVAMQKVVFRGVGYAPTCPLPKGFPFSAADSYPPHERNVEKAKALLAEAGVKLPLKLTMWTSETKERIDGATIVQNMLADVGIEASIRVMEMGALYDALLKGEHDIFFLGWGNNLPDPEYSFARTFCTRGIGSNNYSFFSDPEFDKVMDEGRVSSDRAERQAAYKRAQEILMEKVPAVWWSVGEMVIGTRANVEGFEPLPKTMSRLWKVHFKD